jgi:hypothetical protein
MSPGEIVATYIIPSEFKSMNGLAWDGSQLWGVDYRESTSNRFSRYLPSSLKNLLFSGEIKLEEANAYRLDVSSTADGGVPVVTRTLNLGYPQMEGLAHDGKSVLLVGPRTDATRAGARIVAVHDQHKTVS